MKTEDFIDLLAERQLVPSSILRQLRAKAEQGDHRITADSILKFLVKKEFVTRVQAKELLDSALIVSEKAESSILGRMPPPKLHVEPPPEPRRSSSNEGFGLAPLDEDDDDRPVPLKPLPKAAADKPPVEPPRPPKPPRKREPEDELFAGSTAAPQDVGRFKVVDAAADDLTSGSVPRLGGKKSKKGGKTTRTGKRRGKEQWDSPLLLLGGGGLVLLLLAGVVLWYLMFRESADKVLAQANEHFDKGSYPQAIEEYTTFTEKFSGHKDYSFAKVRLNLSRVWQSVDGNLDPATSLAAVQAAVGEIEDEPAFISDVEASDSKDGLSEAKRQLSALLTRIAKGIADKAEAAKDDVEAKERITQLETALALCANNKYVPEQFRNAAELTAARDTLERVQKRQARDTDLSAALTKMDEAIAKGDTAAAFAVRNDLLNRFPVLADNEALNAKVRDASTAAQSLVKFVVEKKSPTTEDLRTSVIAELTLAERRGEPASTSGAKGVVAVCVDGALFGLQAADGAVLWRRYLGAEANVVPLTLPDGRIIAVDPRAGGLVCLDGATGKLRWRLALEDKLTTPVLAGEQLLVGGESGKLFIINAASGEMSGHVDMPQPIRTSPAVNDRGDRIYLVADQSIVVTLAASDMSCVGVYYLGHSPGAVVAPPIVVLNKLVVAENSGADACRLHVLLLDDKGAPNQEIADSRLAGVVVTPLVEAGRRFAAVTSRGMASVYEMSGAGDAKSLAVLATRDAQDAEQMARYGLLHEGHLWMAGGQLAKLAILPTGNQLSVRSLENDYAGDAFDYPLQLAGNLIIHVRRPAGRAGAIVAATDVTNDRSTWETELAVPLAGAPAVDARAARVSAATASGAVYLLDRQAMSRGVQDQAVRAGTVLDEKTPYTASLDLGDGRLAIAAPGGERLLHFRPDDPRQPVKAIELASPLSCPPVRWREGFVAATEVGQIALFGADAAAKVGAAFQPELKPNQSYPWLRPATAGEGDASLLLVSDGVEKLYAVVMKAEPAPHLEASAAVDVGPSPLVSPLAVAGDRVFAGAASGDLASFELPRLKTVEPIKLGGQIEWGPFPTPAGLLMAIDSGELLMVAGDGAIAWRRKLDHGQLGGEPLVTDKEAVVLHLAGGVARVNLADGSEAAYIDVGQPAVAGPVALGERLLVAAPDGTLLVVNR